MYIVFLVIAIITVIAAMLLLEKGNKGDMKYVNRPTVISNPSSDLLYNQKCAIVSLLAYIQGASVISAYDDEANQIVWSTFSSMGLSKNDVEKMLKLSMNNNPDREINRIIASLKEIRDRSFLIDLKRKCQRIVRISQEADTSEVVDKIFEEIGI